MLRPLDQVSQWNRLCLNMLTDRSYEKELLDADEIDESSLILNLRELEIINKWLGGHASSIHGIKQVLKTKSDPTEIVDIGCGGGDSVKAIAKWCNHKDRQIKFLAIDSKETCINYARENCESIPNVTFICNDFRKALPKSEKSAVILHAALFFHHFSEAEIVDFIEKIIEQKAVIVINDLRRNLLAYFGIKILTQIFSNSYLVKNDAPLSVKRGFKKKDWQSILQMAGVKNYRILNRWAFRHLIIVYPNE